MSTPGPRKFLPPSIQFKTPKPAGWRTPGPIIQLSRSSSSLKQLPPSKFAKTPCFATSNDSIDEIDGSFGHGRSSPTGTRTQRTFRSGHEARYDDLVDEDDEDDLEDEPNYSKTWIAKAEEPKPHRLDHHESTRKPPRLDDTIQDNEADDFPQPTSKRLKTSTEAAKHHDAILISSSGSEEDANHPSNHHGDNDGRPKRSGSNAFDFDSELDDLLLSSPTHTRPSTTTSTLPRFKPSSLPAPHLSSSKPIFKPPPATVSGLHTTPLPDTFSPSRRRGKRDYIPGGLADTVRSWVLELGTSISKPGASTELSKTARVARVQQDIERRCATVQDELGEWYLLVSQGQGRGVEDVRVGDVVEMPGAGTSWGIELEGLVDGRVPEERGVEEGDEVGGERAEGCRTVNVCVLWKLKQ